MWLRSDSRASFTGDSIRPTISTPALTSVFVCLGVVSGYLAQKLRVHAVAKACSGDFFSASP